MTSVAQPVIAARNLSFAFHPSRPILSNISLEVPPGSIYGFLGPNGAGKTTTMRLLTGLLRHPNNSGISLFGQSIDECLPQAFHRMGSLIETPSLYLHLSGLDNLRLLARLRGLQERMAEPALKWVGLERDGQRRVKQYSLGMKQRLAIAMALLSEPELLLLDEPVNGLDPAGMVEMRELMKTLNREKGITIFISSHLLNEVEKMCTHIGIIHRGGMQFEGTMQQLAASSLAEKKLTISLMEAWRWMEVLAAEYPGIQAVDAEKLALTVKDKSEVTAINRKLVLAGAPVYELKLHDGLEEWFMQITQTNS
ncbi:MAG: ABC transporter ATP-binding protein [Chitinophagaceae bacterium]|jgi:ABC-2 type transport system ATP-binding protein|nr:ABC transporter ATP-binding protein [Chitinophagaceae bacterium]